MRKYRRAVEMLATKRLLTAAMSLAILFSAAGCATIASHHGGSEGDRKTAIPVRSDSQGTKQEEVTGKVVRVTP